MTIQELRQCEVEVGDVVQLDPEKTKNAAFAGCFMIVDEVRVWGVQGYVQPLGEKNGERAEGQAYYRAEHGTFERIGKAVWCIAESPTDNTP